jgi:hypothetical protein
VDLESKRRLRTFGHHARYVHRIPIRAPARIRPDTMVVSQVDLLQAQHRQSFPVGISD